MKTFSKLFFLFLIVLSACVNDSVEPDTPIEDQVSFTKGNGSDANDAVNQDRITDNVWITRGNGGGQIFNAKVNSSSIKGDSPVDTEWAIGDKEDRANLTFASFRSTVRPKEVVGKNLVMHLITDDIYLNVRFTSWSSGKQGGFSYIRDKVSE